MKQVVIIDYEGSNLFSVLRAFEHLGVCVRVSNCKDTILRADAAVLPGVGAFGAAMEKLRDLGMIPVIQELISTSKPFLGICLGMQLLFSTSEEFGKRDGLNIFPGQVKRFPVENSDGISNRVPQIGWNTIHKSPTSTNWLETPLQDIPDGSFMYFVHSYYCAPDNADTITSVTNYAGLQYCSSIQAGRTFAAQFHPEKSSTLGLSIYKNWAIQAGVI